MDHPLDEVHPAQAAGALIDHRSLSDLRFSHDQNVGRRQNLDPARLPPWNAASPRRCGWLLGHDRSAAWIAALMYPSAYAIPACQGAAQLICGVWSGMNTPS